MLSTLNDTSLSDRNDTFNIPNFYNQTKAAISSSYSSSSSSFDCKAQCAWKQDAETHQFIEQQHESSLSSSLSSSSPQKPAADAVLQRRMLSPEGYGQLADLALGYHLSTSESNFLSNASLLQDCLPRDRVLIVYFYTTLPRNFRPLEFLLNNVTRPHVVLSNGWGNIWTKANEQAVLQNPYLLRWYGSSQERSHETKFESSFHEKAFPLPLGLIAPTFHYQQLQPLLKFKREQRQQLQNLSNNNKTKTSHYQSRPNLLLINFSTNPEKAAHREVPWHLFCNSSYPGYIQGGSNDNNTITCKSGGFFDRGTNHSRRRYVPNDWNDMAASHYHEWSTYKYTLSPRGQQKDCHRFWEALYVGSVPIVLKRDGYYQDLLQYYFRTTQDKVPILFVQRWRHATPALLHRLWKERFEPILLHDQNWNTFPPKYLTTDYTQQVIVRDVKEILFQLKRRHEHHNATVQVNGGTTADASLEDDKNFVHLIKPPETMFEQRTRCYAPTFTTTTAMNALSSSSL